MEKSGEGAGGFGTGKSGFGALSKAGFYIAKSTCSFINN
jgi:hypothetical protein